MVMPLEGSRPWYHAAFHTLLATSFLPIGHFLTRLLDARKRASGRFGYNGLSRGREPFQQNASARMNSRAPPQFGIPQRVAGVADQPAPFCALDGAVSEHFPEFCFAHTR